MKKFLKVCFVLGVVGLLYSFLKSSDSVSDTLEKKSISESNISEDKKELLSKYGNDRIIFIDFSKPSYSKRLWVLEGDSVLLNTYVSHGENSGLYFAKKFSNEEGTNMSCVGEFRTLWTYNGKHGLSMKIQGLDDTNNNAYDRKIVFHSAPYATKDFLNRHGYLGRSYGCFATSEEDNKLIIDLATEKISIKVLVVS